MSGTIQSVRPSVEDDASADSSPVQAADISTPVATTDMYTHVTTTDTSPLVATTDIPSPRVAMDAIPPGEQVVEKPQAKTCQSSLQVGTMLSDTGNNITTRCWKPTDSLHPR